MKKIQDYIHFHIGCKFRYRYIDWAKDSWSHITILTLRDCDKIVNDLSIDKVELWLRQLSDITSAERAELDIIHNPKEHTLMTHYESMRQLLKLQVDIFGLIEAGLATDKTKIKTDE